MGQPLVKEETSPTRDQQSRYSISKPIKAKLRCLHQLTAMILKWMIHIAEIVKGSLKRNSNHLRQSSFIGRVAPESKYLRRTFELGRVRVACYQIPLNSNLRLGVQPSASTVNLPQSLCAQLHSKNVSRLMHKHRRSIRDVTIVSVIRIIRLLFFFHVNAN